MLFIPQVIYSIQELTHKYAADVVKDSLASQTLAVGGGSGLLLYSDLYARNAELRN